MHPYLKYTKARALRMKFGCFGRPQALLLGLCVLLIAVHGRAEDTPVPEKKPPGQVEQKVIEEVPAAATEELDETAANEADSDALSSLLDFTSALLDFESSPVPIPQRKPEFIPQKPSAVEKLLKLARNQVSQDPLSRQDAKLYKLVFDAQKKGDMKAADAVLEDIKDPRLIGHVLFQRYMHPRAYKSTFAELRQWLEIFSDHPGAKRIYKLANARKPEGFSGKIQKPGKARGIVRTHEPSSRTGKRYVSSRKRNDEDVRKLNKMNREVYRLVRKGQPDQAFEHLLKEPSILDNVEFDLLRAEIAGGYLYQGQTDKAQKLATLSIQRSGLHVPKAGWVAGLVAWRNRDYKRAARAFEVVARSPYASGWTLTAGAYWAARSHMRMGNVKEVSTWLKRGVSQPRTFYGLVSIRALGRDFDFNWKIPPFTKNYLSVLAQIPAGSRAMALVAAGQPHLAEAELVRVLPKTDEQRTALLAYAGYANLPGLALRVASDATADQDAIYDAALYPMGPWQINEGFKIDPALVYAIMRQESRFDPRAKSPSGARGLMQLMPATAKSVAGKSGAQLDNPETSLELGQRYLEDLLDTNIVGGDLLSLLIAYNAGPGNLAKWKKRWSDVKDPLLFIELIPLSETRTYVERVLSNYWIYRLREGQDTPTLDAIAAGQPALYNSEAL